MKSFPHYRQHDAMDCGPTCLRMVAKHYGKHFNLDTLRQQSGFSKEGVSLLGISEAAEKIGYCYLIKNFIKANMAPNCVAQKTKAQSNNSDFVFCESVPVLLLICQYVP